MQHDMRYHNRERLRQLKERKKAFIEDIIAVCKIHGMVLAIDNYDGIFWVMDYLDSDQLDLLGKAHEV